MAYAEVDHNGYGLDSTGTPEAGLWVRDFGGCLGYATLHLLPLAGVNWWVSDPPRAMTITFTAVGQYGGSSNTANGGTIVSGVEYPFTTNSLTDITFDQWEPALVTVTSIQFDPWPLVGAHFWRDEVRCTEVA